ncbi:uncharacterized protein SAPINGB_P004328 [Magnusiomyces paraingens]|uniref:NADP-dependent oxidoreductase domain-containing protein n=1 Tax=Magnusiomyces paraingens TaxID=2606893 RepID=A0A5E8BWA1_9ASCO|nr:uncharacterized protein SAPINGB_P004328 [Saprochaete ingens]VVT54919.1 unnamed protein product [Saprochaete ingens]
MSPSIPTFKLNNGITIPAVGYGTGTKWFKSSNLDELDEKVVDAVALAISNGYTHIDTAEVYNTEGEVAAAIKKAGVPREKLYITTKVLPKIGNPEAALADSLKKLGIDYIDLYLIHAPFVTEEKHGISLEDAWAKLEKFQEEGKVKTIGVSNFAIADLERILKVAKIKPAVNQIEYNAYLQNQTPGIVKFSQDHGILVEAYSPLGPVIAKDEKAPLKPVLEKIATKYKKTPAQVELRWTYQNGVLPITTSADSGRQTQSLEIFDFELTDDEVQEIRDVGLTYTFRQYWKPEYGKYENKL